MAEITDEPISNPVENKKNEQDNTGNAVSRFFERTIDTGADRGLLLYTGLQSAIYPEKHEAFKQQRANAARMAELQLQQAEINVENARQSGRNLVQQFDQSKAAHPHRLAKLQAEEQLNTLRAQQAQHAVWDNDEAQFRTKATDRLNQMVNRSQLNIAGQYIIDNSQAAKAFVDVTYLMHAAKDPAKLKYMLGKFAEDGWKVVPREDGEIQLDGMVDGKPMSFVANPAGLQKVTGMIQGQLKDDITAAKIIGLDAANMGQATAKTILQNPIVKRVCGDDSAAYRVYSDFYNKKTRDPKSGQVSDVFSPEQKMYHTLNVSLGAALEDNKFNDTEKATLLPQVQQMIKTLGGELKIGDTVENTTVVWGRNQGYAQTYTIKDFLHTVLRDKDVITPLFGEHLQILAQKMKNNQLGSGNGSGENVEAEKRLSDAELAMYTKSYGAQFAKLPPDIQANITDAESAVDNIAMDMDIVSPGPDGKYRMKTDIPMNELRAMADEERAIFKKYSMESIAPRGKWNLMYNERKNASEAKKNTRNADKYEASAKKLISIANNKEGGPFATMANIGLMQGAAYQSMLGENSRRKSANAKEKADKAHRRLEKNNALNKEKQKQGK